MIDLSPSFGGVPVISSPLAVARVSNRVHRQRRGQSAAYHARVQKKWDKRFGFSDKPQVYATLDPIIGRTVIIMHSSLYERLKEELKRQHTEGPWR